MLWNLYTRILAIACLLLSAPCAAAMEFNEEDPKTDKATMPYDRVLDMTEVDTPGIISSAESAVRTRQFERAVQLCRQALKDKPDDLNLHRIYAFALEGKLDSQKERDETIYQECIEEWLCVMRSGVGEEAGINVKGAGYVWDYLLKDEDRYVLGKHHLQSLTGFTPHPFETNIHFMKRVLKPSLKGTIVKKTDKENVGAVH